LTSDSPYFEKPVEGLKDKVTRGVAWTTGLHFVSKAAELVFIAILARLLAPTEFGVVAAALVFITLAKLFVELGVGATIVQLPDLTRYDVRTGGTIVLLSALLFFVATQLGAPAVAALFGIAEVEGVLRLLAFIFLLQAIGVIPENLLIRRLKAPRVMMVETVARLIGYGGIGALCAWSGLSYWSLAIGALAEVTIKAVTLAVMVRPPLLPMLHGPSLRRVLSTGASFSLSRILNYVATSADKVIAARYLGAAALGLYGRAYHLMSVPADLYGRVGDRLVFPAMAACQHEPERLRRAFLSGASITATLGIPMTIVLVLLAPEIITFLLGQNWIGVIAPLMVLAAASYFRLGARVGGSLLRATGAFKSLVWTQAGYAGAIIAGCILAAPYGVNAIAAVVSVTLAVFFLAISLLACRRAATSLRRFIAAHTHGMMLGVLTAIILGTLVYSLRSVGAPDYAILLASGLAMIGGGVLLIAWPRRWLIGAPAVAIAKDVRAAATARLSRLTVHRATGVKETSA
jgi:O-antigen/teichoic acid export membrane protein